MADRTPLFPLTPLGRREPMVETIGAFTIAENTATAIASVAARRGRIPDVEGMAGAAGLDLPGPGKMSPGEPWTAVWTGPGQWLVLASLAQHEDIVAVLGPLFGDAVSLAEQTDGFARFDIEGPRPAALMERLCPIDVDAMAPGDATRSVVEHIGCHLLCLAADRLSLLAPRSFAASLHHALTEAARSVAAIAALR